MSNSSEPPEKWQRVLAAAKASQADTPTGNAEIGSAAAPTEFSTTLLERVRAFHASLAAWQRWSLVAGLISILLFIASFIYLKSTDDEATPPLIKTPGIDLPQPTTPTEH
jgi:hypothetical protein